MSGFSHLPLQQSIYETLTGDTVIMNLVAGIFDRPPQGGEFPYVSIGESAITDRSTKTTDGTEQMVMLHVWSREGGRTQAATIMERIYALLHQADLTVTGQTCILIRFVSSKLMLENDGFTYHGTMQFRALLEAN